MRKICSNFSTLALVLLVGIPMPSWGNGQSADDEMLRRIQALERKLEDMKQLERELEDLKAQLRTTQTAAEQAETVAQKAQKQAQAAEKGARAAERADAKWHLAGYASTGFRASDEGDEEDTFVAGKFNPVFHFLYKDFVLFEGELEFEVESDGETGVELEYSTIDLLIHDNAILSAGKFLSPIGQFPSRLHPDWVNKLPDAPAGFQEGSVQPFSEVGVMLRGGFAFNPLINYAFFGGNGPRVELEDGELEAFELEGFGEDDNDDKALGGRIGVLPIPNLEIGGSFMVADVEGKKEAGIEGSTTEGDYALWGVDAAYTRGPWDIRFEYLSSELDSFFSQTEPDEETELVPQTDFEAWYVQAAYQLSGLTDRPFLRSLEPVIRYGEVDADGFEEFVETIEPEHRLTIGLNYLFAPSIVAKLAVSWRDFEDPDTEDETEVRGQLAYGF